MLKRVRSEAILIAAFTAPLKTYLLFIATLET